MIDSFFLFENNSIVTEKKIYLTITQINNMPNSTTAKNTEPPNTIGGNITPPNNVKRACSFPLAFINTHGVGAYNQEFGDTG